MKIWPEGIWWGPDLKGSDRGSRPSGSVTSSSQTPALVEEETFQNTQKSWKEQKYGQGSRNQDLVWWRGLAALGAATK